MATAAGMPQAAAWDQQAELLFTQHGIEDIRAAERQKRDDISKKQAELRQLVGHSYRDLIDAADTIVKMASSTAEVMSSVSNMQRLCTQLQNGAVAMKGPGAAGGAGGQDVASRKQFYSVAVQMKLLMDTPEKVWSALEHGRLYPATYLYLLALTTYSNLTLESEAAGRRRGGPGKLFSRFPILKRQWASISQFRENICDHSKEVLGKDEYTLVQVLGALASMALLDGMAMDQLLALFLKSRISALRRILKRELSGAKDQIASIVQLLVMTVREVHLLFLDTEDADRGQQPCLLSDFLRQVTASQGDKGARPSLFQESHVLMQATPRSITDFCPEYKGDLTALPTGTVHTATSKWLETVADELQPGIARTLRFVPSVENLAAARDRAWLDLQQLNAAGFSFKGEGTEAELRLCDVSCQLLDTPQADWEAVSRAVLGQPVSLWAKVLEVPFLQRAEGILTGRFRETAAHCVEATRAARAAVSPADRDMSECLWRAGQFETWDFGLIRSDVAAPSQAGKVSVARALSLHAGGFTPAVEAVYLAVNAQLQAFLDDARCFIEAKDGRRDRPSPDGASPFDKFSTAVQLRRFAQTGCEEFVRDLVAQLAALHQDSAARLKDPACGEEGRAEALDQILVVARVLKGIAERCSVIEELVLLPSDTQSAVTALGRSRATRFRRLSSGSRGQVNEHQRRVAAARAELEAASVAQLSVWAEHLATTSTAAFREVVLGREWAVLPEQFAVWHDSRIEEDAEGGGKVESIVRLPNQASGSLLRFLTSISSEVTRCGGHALPSPALKHLCTVLSDGLLSAHEALLAEHTAAAGGAAAGEGSEAPDGGTSGPRISQRGALQLLFDVRFLSDILSGRSDPDKALAGRASRLTAGLTALVDPFDMDVFAPLLREAQGRAYCRTAVLLGNLIRTPLLHGSVRVTLASQENHNVLPLAPPAPRFPTLPVGSSGGASSGGGGGSGSGSGGMQLAAAGPLLPPALPLHAVFRGLERRPAPVAV